MAHGTGSTLVLSPTGGTAITFNMSGATAGITTYTMIVDAGRLDFNEETRWQWVYEQNPKGGRVTGANNQLVPITFSVIIKAATADYRRAAYKALQTAVMNRQGGMLKYRPEGSGQTVLDTYFHYVASKPPRLVDDPGNRWDSDAGSDGFYTLEIDVELMTQPLATSDPSNPIALTSSPTTLSNGDYIAISSAAIKGSLPALVRLLVTPKSGQRLGRVTLFRRSDGTLANLVALYEAEDATPILISGSTAWSEVADSARWGNAYMKCLPNPDANEVTHGLTFTLMHPSDSKGRFAVFGIGYDDGETGGVWRHKAKLRSGNLSQESDWHYASSLESWQAIYVGEFELPMTDVAALTTGYDAGPYLDWYSTRLSGTSEFRLDGLALVWVSDALGAEGEGTALDVVCDDANESAVCGGVQSPEKLLIENFPGLGGVLANRAYVVDATNDLVRVLRTAPRGDFVELEAGRDHRLYFLQERAVGVMFTDDFEGYFARTILPISSLDEQEGSYYTGTFKSYTSNCREGKNALQLSPPPGYWVAEEFYRRESALDLEIDDRFANGDFVCIAVEISNADDLIVYFATGLIWEGGFSYNFEGLSNGTHFLHIKKNAFNLYGPSVWSKIRDLGFQYTKLNIGASGTARLDYLRIEKADPNDANHPNATGDVWDFQPNTGAWTITQDITEDEPGAVLACLDWELGVEKVALLDRVLQNDIRATARACGFVHTGSVGVLWRASDDCLTEGAESGYAAYVNTTPSNSISILRYDAGTPTTLYSTGFGSPVYLGHWCTVGIRAKGDNHRVYVALSSTLLYDDSAVFGKDYLVTEITDDTYASGKFGFASISTLGRFDNVVIESAEDKLVPTDQIEVDCQAVFRTIAPFDA